MKPFARTSLSSAALRRGILVSFLALGTRLCLGYPLADARPSLRSAATAAAGCCSIERTGEYYIATKTMTFQKLDEYHREKGDSTYMPLPFSIGIPDKNR